VVEEFMTSRGNKRGSNRAVLTAGLAASLSGQLLPAFAQTVQDKYLSRVTAQENGACATVNVDFNVPVRYTSHFPEIGGRELRIGVQPVNTNRGSLSTGRAAESVRPPASKIAGIQQITYDASDPAGPTLVVQFDHDATWKVEADKNVARLVIKVSRSARDGCVPGGASATATGQASNIILSVTKTIPDKLDPTGNYSINLSSNRGAEVAPNTIKTVDAFSRYAAYAYTSEENGVTWARLRLGMFATRADAERVLAEVQKQYPDAWVTRLDRTERDRVYQAWLTARGQAAPQSGGAALSVNPQAEALLADLRSKLAAGDNAEAIRLAQNILGLPESAASPEAQELLGLARERNQQLAHARAEYETYLQRYPANEGAPRVRQRLAALLGEEQRPDAVARTTATGEKEKAPVRGEASGSLSVLYQHDESGFLFQDVPVVGGPEVNPDPIEENRTNLDEVLYGADLNLSVGNDRTEALLRFSGIYRDDFRADAPRDEGAISALYFDISDREWNSSFRLGRQTRNTGGVFGRFDGALASVQVADRIKLNAVAGLPVQSSRDLEINTDRVFYGGSVDLSLVPDHLDTGLYYIDQSYGDLIDRRAVGLEFRYFDAERSAYGVFDYDVHYGKLNLALLNGMFQFKDNSSFSVSVDYRRAPLLTTQNAIIGQGVDDPNLLLPTYTEREIYQLAEDRTAYSRSASLSYSRPLAEKLQFNVDVIATNVSSTKASVGIDAQPPTGTELFWSGQLVASDIFKEGAILIVGLRYADLAMNEQYTLQANGRYPITRDVRLNTKIRVDQRIRKDDSSDEVSVRGSLALSYNYNRMTHLDLEFGGQYSDQNNILVTTRETGVFFNIGLRRDF
jgi:hypothetical protein